LCDHLLVIDEDAPEDTRVVGTYRLLRESVARRAGGFYSAGNSTSRH
jgi:putative hemolysin